MMRILPDETVLQTLRCPICNSNMSLQKSGDSLYCHGGRKHCYDLASSGYINLMPPGHASGGDSKQAVRARTDFLNLELYRPVADALADAVCRHKPTQGKLLIDAGCGEGYYTALLAKRGFSVAGVDLSRPAADSAARRATRQGLKNGFYAVASVYDLPFAEESASVVTNVFAPCAEDEFCRVLGPKGILAVAYAGPEHLMGLKRVLYDQTRENDGRADLPRQMELIEELRVRFDITVNGCENVQNLFAMTPYYWRTSPADSEKLKRIDRLETAVDILIAIYRKPNRKEPE